MAEQALIKRVSRILEERFPGVELNLDVGESGRPSGWIVWQGFEGHDQIDRGRMVRDALASLPPEDRLSVGPILTLTPYEASDDEEAA
jgi:hypothetical protein